MRQLSQADIAAANIIAQQSVERSQDFCFSSDRPRMIRMLERIYAKIPTVEVRRAIQTIKEDNARAVVPKKREVA